MQFYEPPYNRMLVMAPFFQIRPTTLEAEIGNLGSSLDRKHCGVLREITKVCVALFAFP
jgi:hypothetical protein